MERQVSDNCEGLKIQEENKAFGVRKKCFAQRSKETGILPFEPRGVAPYEVPYGYSWKMDVWRGLPL